MGHDETGAMLTWVDGSVCVEKGAEDTHLERTPKLLRLRHMFRAQASSIPPQQLPVQE